jgi:hypothetical protein
MGRNEESVPQGDKPWKYFLRKLNDMRHAFLILAHADWEQLKTLLRMLDAENHDFYIHIDKKSKNVPIDDIKSCVKYASVEIAQRFNVFWGGFSQVEVEMFLMDMASQKDYEYYHILSGADLPIKSNADIDKFFDQFNGYEFLSFSSKNQETIRRTKLYHFLQNYRRRYKYKPANALFTFAERVSLLCQLALGVDRMKKHPDVEIKYGSNWCSLTDSAVKYILTQKEMIREIFQYTNCADELFIHTVLWNSEFKDKIFISDDITPNLRLIDWKRGKNGSPYTFRMCDMDMILSSNCLFARKFNTAVDKEIIEAIYTEIGGRHDICNRWHP